VTPTLAITLRLRYDTFGQFANVLAYPASQAFDPPQFLMRHEVNTDYIAFGPALRPGTFPQHTLRFGWTAVRRRQNRLARSDT
jgi:hypothetical protein